MSETTPRRDRQNLIIFWFILNLQVRPLLLPLGHRLVENVPRFSSILWLSAKISCMTIEQTLQVHRTNILQLARQYGARNLRLFGSVARHEERPESDIDFLVEMEQGRTLLDLIGFSQDLESLLHRKVDVLTDDSLSPYLKERIQSESRPL